MKEKTLDWRKVLSLLLIVALALQIRRLRSDRTRALSSRQRR